ncbi:hypothetical protein Mvan_4042 [Mycolicibacterium vanbaalenii PYR-1]|uniref:Uncharacterized protein n=1 Tax=Mycolicibacterium vanbaalenii (strain DSM 7251 / JCM 13017 / BCRC 16820 / KCTC 9966 / NRRL B-24157 / PYR-1) TaxID=350058 RepID=A1TCB9_MYCVP|nr:hypothetical protein Mvan_4042 [Mycolicibacterium vanbaalenii PYR-1]
MNRRTGTAPHRGYRREAVDAHNSGGEGARQRYLSSVGTQQGGPTSWAVSSGAEGGDHVATTKKTVKVLPGQTKKVKTGNVVWTIKRGR